MIVNIFTRTKKHLNSLINKSLSENQILPLLVLTFLIFGLFWKFWLQGKIPFPGDALVGMYFPWLDYKWGYEVGVPVKNPIITDVFSQFFIWKYMSIDFFKAGILPLWNPYSFSGTPLLATYHSAVLFPLNIVLLLPNYDGWGVFIFLQVLTAALGVYFLSGYYVKSFTVKIVAGLVFSMSGLMTTWSEFGTGAWSMAFLPWCIYFIEKYIQQSKKAKSVIYLNFFSISLVFLYLAGNMQVSFYASVALGFYLIFSLIIKKSIELRNFFELILFWILAIGISAIQLIPSYALTLKSIRPFENYASSYDFGFIYPYELIKIIAADFFGNPSTSNYWGPNLYHEQSLFMGSLTLPLIAPLFWEFKKNKNIIFYLVLFFASIMLGLKNPITSFIYSLDSPLLTYSFASRIIFMTSLSAAILVALSIDKLLNNQNYIKHVRGSLLLTSLLLIIFASFVVVSYTNGLQIHLDSLQIVPSNLLVGARNLILPIVILVSFTLVTILFRNRILLSIVVITIMFFDLSRYYLKYNPFVDQNLVFPETPVTSFLKSDNSIYRIARGDREILPPNTWAFYNISSIEGYDPMALRNYGQFFNLINNSEYTSSLSRYMELTTLEDKFLDLLNVKYILAVKRDPNGKIPGESINTKLVDTKYKIVFEDKTSAILENTGFQERIFFTKKIKSFTNNQEIANYMLSKNYNPSREVIILSDANKDEDITQGKILYSSYKPGNIKIKTESALQSLLVISESFDEDWKLVINGHPEKIYNVDLALMGFFVPPGTSDIELTYMPRSVEWGVKTSVASTICLFTLTSFLLVLKLSKSKKVI